MLDVFLHQKATKVIVGDTYQQIYGWRYAVNSLEKADFKTFHLSTSFRFSQDIANLAMEVLAFKNHMGAYTSIAITGKGTGKQNKTKAVLARTNLGLLLKAIEYVTEKKQVKHIYFEGNINSYTYADDGASLYDVLNLYNGKKHLIKDTLIKAMKDLEELEDYIDKTEDVQLGMMVDIVKEYGNEIPGIIKNIKDKHVDNDNKEKAEMIFSTVHRCKGMEYDTIQLVNDFITEKKIEKLKEDKEAIAISAPKLNEEINLLYVAITRTKNSIHIPEGLMPAAFPASPHIHVMKVLSEEVKKTVDAKDKLSKYRVKGNDDKGHKVSEARTEYKGAYQPWTPALDNELTEMYCNGISIKDMSKHFGRTKSAIASRVKKLQLEELYG